MSLDALIFIKFNFFYNLLKLAILLIFYIYKNLVNI